MVFSLIPPLCKGRIGGVDIENTEVSFGIYPPYPSLTKGGNDFGTSLFWVIFYFSSGNVERAERIFINFNIFFAASAISARMGKLIIVSY